MKTRRLLQLILAIVGCACTDGGDGIDPSDASSPPDAASADAGGPDAQSDAGVVEYEEICGPDHEWPEETVPLPGSALVLSHTFGFSEGDELLTLEGASRFRGPGNCTARVPPDAYTVGLYRGDQRIAETEVDLGDGSVTLLAVAQHPLHGPTVRAMLYDFSSVEPGEWRIQLVNLAPTTYGGEMDVYTFAPGTAYPPPLGAEPLQVGAVPFGAELRTVMPAGAEILAFLPSTSTLTPHVAAFPTTRGCAATMGTAAHIIWCDSLTTIDDPGGPCENVAGSQWYFHTLEGASCFR